MYAFMQNYNSTILIGVKRILSFLGIQFSKQHGIENGHTFKCGIIASKQKKQRFIGSIFSNYMYNIYALNDQEYLLE